MNLRWESQIILLYEFAMFIYFHFVSHHSRSSVRTWSHRLALAVSSLPPLFATLWHWLVALGRRRQSEWNIISHWNTYINYHSEFIALIARETTSADRRFRSGLNYHRPERRVKHSTRSSRVNNAIESRQIRVVSAVSQVQVDCLIGNWEGEGTPRRRQIAYFCAVI